jgi:hypothetical protein
MIIGEWGVLGGWDNVDTTTPVLTATPSTTTYNQTVGYTFTPPTVTVSDTDANGDPVTATVTPTVNDGRDGQGVGAVTYTYNYTDGTNQATPIVVTVNWAAVVIESTVITVSGQSVTTIPFNGTLPVFTSSTNNGSPVTIGGDTPVNNVAGTYVVTFDAAEASQVTRIVVVQAEGVVIPDNISAFSNATAVFWQHSDNFYQHTPSIADYTEAEYIIADRRGKVLVYLTLNSGITASNGDLVIHVDDSLIDFRGCFYHQLVLTDANGNKLPPEFQSKLKVKRVFVNEAG